MAGVIELAGERCARVQPCQVDVGVEQVGLVDVGQCLGGLDVEDRLCVSRAFAHAPALQARGGGQKDVGEQGRGAREVHARMRHTPHQCREGAQVVVVRVRDHHVVHGPVPQELERR